MRRKMEIKSCPICKSSKIKNIVYRKNMPVYQNRLFDDELSAKECEKRDLEFSICNECGFVFNGRFDTSLNLYDGDYNNSQVASEKFKHYMETSFEYMRNTYDAMPKKIVEIGCGKKAEYLQMMSEYWGGGANCQNILREDKKQIIGYDPSYDANDNSKIVIYPRYFDFKKEKTQNVDWLICRHVIEHISQPLELFDNVHGLNTGNPKSIAYFETPDVTWIFRNSVVFDFFYEHCSLFSPSSIMKLGEIAGVNIDNIVNAFGGQYMWIFSQNKCYKNNTEQSKIYLDEILALAEKYKKEEKFIFEKIYNMLLERRKKRIVLWGAGAKGNIFLNIFDRDKSIVDYVVDVNIEKNGKYIAGTGHEIKGPSCLKLEEYCPEVIVVMNEQYYEEIKTMIKNMCLKNIEIISIEKVLRDNE